MPQLPATKKSLRQSIVHRDRNRARKKTMRLAVRAALEAAKSGDEQAVVAAVSAAQKAFDKAAKVGAIHKGAADRRKSRMMKQIAIIRAAG